MKEYSLEVNFFGCWEFHGDFASIDRARDAATEFAGHEWRVFNRIRGVIVWHHTPAEMAQRIADQRFRSRERWRDHFGFQRQRERRLQSQIENFFSVIRKNAPLEPIEVDWRKDGF